MKSKSVLLGAVLVAIIGIFGLLQTKSAYAQVSLYPDEFTYQYFTNAQNVAQIRADPVAGAPHGTRFLTRTEIPDPGGNIIIQESTYTDAGDTIVVDNCTFAANAVTGNGNVSISVSGSRNTYPCNDDPDNNGGLEAQILITNLQDLENPNDYSPVSFALVNSSNVTVGTASVSLDTANQNTIIASFGNIPEGTYTLEASANGNLVGQWTGVEVEAGENNTQNFVISLQEFENGVTGAVPEAEPTCESVNKGVGWILCDVMVWSLDVLDSLISKGLVEGILVVEFEDQQRDVLQSIWNGFRAIANLGFVIAFFIIIYSAASGNMLSAYDVKRLLPRLVIAVIAVQLSFVISLELIAIFNDIGRGIAEILLAPIGGDTAGEQVFSRLFADNPLSSGSVVLDWLGGVFFSILLVTLLIVVAWGAIGGIILMGIVFLVRSMVLVVMIVLSPLAFVAWILPGTNSIFTLWWKWFIQLLAIFPIAAAFFAAGRLIGAIWIGGGAGSGAADTAWGTIADGLAVIVGTIAIFAPYFLAPFMFRFAGSAIASIVGGVNTMKEKFGESESYQRARDRVQSGKAPVIGRAGMVFQKPSNLLPTKAGRRQRAITAERVNQYAEQDTAVSAVKIRDDVAREKAKPANEGKNPMEVERDFLRDIVSDESRSVAERRAAFNQLAIVHSGDAETSDTLMQVLDKANSSGDRKQIEMATAMTQDNIGGILKDMPQILKGGKSSSTASIEKTVEMKPGSVQQAVFDEFYRLDRTPTGELKDVRQGVKNSIDTTVNYANRFVEAAQNSEARGKMDTDSVAMVVSSIDQKLARADIQDEEKGRLQESRRKLEQHYDIQPIEGRSVSFSGFSSGSVTSPYSQLPDAQKYSVTLKPVDVQPVVNVEVAPPNTPETPSGPTPSTSPTPQAPPPPSTPGYQQRDSGLIVPGSAEENNQNNESNEGENN